MPFTWFVAMRYLRAAKGQTALILAAVAVGVAVVVFLSALIEGLQVSLVDKTLGAQAHVTLEVPERTPRALVEASERAVAKQSEPGGRHPQPKDEATHRIHSLFRLRMPRLSGRLPAGCRGRPSASRPSIAGLRWWPTWSRWRA